MQLPYLVHAAVFTGPYGCTIAPGDLVLRVYPMIKVYGTLVSVLLLSSRTWAAVRQELGWIRPVLWRRSNHETRLYSQSKPAEWEGLNDHELFLKEVSCRT